MNLPPELQSALLGQRTVFLRGPLDDAAASTLIGQLLLVSRTSPDHRIDLFIDSSGGSLSAALAVYDFLRTLPARVSTICSGRAGGASVLVLAGGADGVRYALPHARIGLKEESAALPAGNVHDLPGRVDEAARLRDRWLAALVRHTVHSTTQLARDLTTGRWLSAAEARDYGLVDGIVPGPPAGSPGRQRV